MDPKLREFVEAVIIPALVDRWKAAFQCGICGAFITRTPKGQCKRCGTEWSNG